MQRFNRNATILLAAAIAGGLVFLMFDRSAGSTEQAVSAAASNAAQNVTDPLKASTLSEDGTSVRDLAAFKAKLLKNLHRVMMLDPTMSDEELLAFESELATAAEHDPRARKILIDELMSAFADMNPSNVYLLERVLSVSKPGSQALSGVYTDIVLGQSKGPEFYALQGLKNLQNDIPERQMGTIFDKALTQLDRYDSFAEYSPAMTFAAQAIKQGRYQPSTAQKSALISSIERRQAVSTDQQEQFFTAQSMIWMASPSDRAALVEQMLRRYPNRGTFAAVLESIEVGDFEPNNRLMSSLEVIARQLSEKGTG